MDPREQVARAMTAVPRRDFLRAAHRDSAEFDGPLTIGHGQTNSQPRTVAAMLELLDVQPGQHVLDVGAGSGWTTALLAHLTGAAGRVLGIERIPELAEFGAENLDRAGMPWAHLRPSRPRVLGAPEDGPFDRILVSAEAQTLPVSLVEQLARGGVMVIPVGGTLLRVACAGTTDAATGGTTGTTGSERTPSGARTAYGVEGVTVERHGAYRFVPLITS